MSDTTFHLTHSHLNGPAERTLVQPWIGELTGLSLNAYAEQRPPALASVEPLAPVGNLTAQHPASTTRIALAA